MRTVENFAEFENMQGKNQFARFRILQTEEGEHVYIIYSLVMLTSRTEVISGMYSADTVIILLVTHSTAGVILCLL